MRATAIAVTALAGLLAPPWATSTSTAHLSFDRFTIVVPDRWHSSPLPGSEGRAIRLSNSSLRRPGGSDPIKGMAPGTFVLTLLPLGDHGSPSTATILRSDFLARDDPARPRGRAAARSFYCSAGGPCLSIALLYGRPQVPAGLLFRINETLRTLRAA
jgi:hypothetical protein